MVNSKRFLRPKKRGGKKGSRKRMRGGTLEDPKEGEIFQTTETYEYQGEVETYLSEKCIN